MPMFLRKLLGKNEAQGEAGQKSTQAPHGMQTMQPMLQRKFAKGVQYNMKIVIRGDRNVGKSCLFYRLQGQKFKEEYLPTEEIQVASIQWNYKATDDVVKVEVWDVVDKGKKKKKIDGLKLENENMGTTDPWGGSGTHSETSDRLPEDPCLDAEFIDVYKGTHGVIMMMDITKQWTFSYIERELPKVPSNIPVLVLANHRDMGHHRTVNEDTVRYFIENLERPEGAAEVKYAEASMRNGFGLKYLHKFFNLPFLQLQRETLLRQLETNKRDIESTIEELGIHEESEEQNYELFMEALANKRREQQEKLSEASRSEAASPAVSNGPTSGVAAPAREAPPAHPIPGLSVTPATPASPEQASPQAATTNSNPVSPATSDQADRSTESTPAAEEPGERKGFITRFFRKAKEPKPVIPVEDLPTFDAEIAEDTEPARKDVVASVEDFVPDSGALDSFLDDTRDVKTTNAAAGYEQDSDSDEGVNPMVAGFKEDLDSEDEVMGSAPVVMLPSYNMNLSSDEDDPKEPTVITPDVFAEPKSTLTPPPRESKAELLSVQSEQPLSLPVKDANLTVDWVVKTSSQAQLPSSASSCMPPAVVHLGLEPPESRVSESPPSNASEEEEVPQVEILQDEEDISEEETAAAAEDAKLTADKASKTSAQETKVPTNLGLQFEDLSILEHGIDSSTGLPRPASTASDMAGSSRHSTDTEREGHSSTKKKKHRSKDKDQETDEKTQKKHKHKKHRDKDKGEDDGKEKKKKKKTKRKEEDKKEMDDLEAFLNGADQTSGGGPYETL